MSFRSLDFLLQQAESSEKTNAPKKSCKIDLQTPFGLNDLMFDDNELYPCDQITTSISQLHLDDNEVTDSCSSISDYISKHLSLLSTDDPKPSVVENVNDIKQKLPLADKNNKNCANILKHKDKPVLTSPRQNKGGRTHNYKIFRTKTLARVQKSPLEKSDTGLSSIIGRKYPKSNSNLMNNYLCNVLVETRSRGFRFNTPSPDELVLSWMDIVRQMPNK